MGEGEEEAEEDASRVYMEGMREEVGRREARPEATVLWATFLTIMAVDAGGVERVGIWSKPVCRAYETRAIGQARVIWPRRRNKPARLPRTCACVRRPSYRRRLSPLCRSIIYIEAQVYIYLYSDWNQTLIFMQRNASIIWASTRCLRHVPPVSLPASPSYVQAQSTLLRSVPR